MKESTIAITRCEQTGLTYEITRNGHAHKHNPVTRASCERVYDITRRYYPQWEFDFHTFSYWCFWAIAPDNIVLV